MKLEYMPHFLDTENRVWDILALHFVVGWSGRGVEIECSCDGLQGLKFFVYSYKDNKLSQYASSEVVDSTPIHGAFWEHCHNLFKTFDNE